VDRYNTGRKMGLSPSQIKNLIAGAFLHDVGKIATPDNILLKPGKLDGDEMVIMKNTFPMERILSKI